MYGLYVGLFVVVISTGRSIDRYFAVYPGSFVMRFMSSIVCGCGSRRTLNSMVLLE